MPHAGTWIEMMSGTVPATNIFMVVPHAGTWIEIWVALLNRCLIRVVPHAGTWIEIRTRPGEYGNTPVVPHAGTWIEIRRSRPSTSPKTSCLTQARGLKFILLGKPLPEAVVPHAGTWIEMGRAALRKFAPCRASRRHVD